MGYQQRGGPVSGSRGAGDAVVCVQRLSRGLVFDATPACYPLPSNVIRFPTGPTVRALSMNGADGGDGATRYGHSPAAVRMSTEGDGAT